MPRPISIALIYGCVGHQLPQLQSKQLNGLEMLIFQDTAQLHPKLSFYIQVEEYQPDCQDYHSLCPGTKHQGGPPSNHTSNFQTI